MEEAADGIFIADLMDFVTDQAIQFALAQIQANRDRRARAMRRSSLLREQDLTRKLGYK